MIEECEECGGIGVVHHPIKGEGMIQCGPCVGRGWIEKPEFVDCVMMDTGKTVQRRIVSRNIPRHDLLAIPRSMPELRDDEELIEVCGDLRPHIMRRR